MTQCDNTVHQIHAKKNWHVRQNMVQKKIGIIMDNFLNFDMMSIMHKSLISL